MSVNKRGIGSDLAKVDAYRNTDADYEELPELDDTFFARAEAQVNGKPALGRPPLGPRPKKQVTLRLDQDVLERFRERGIGWQSKMNKALRARSSPLREVEERELRSENVNLGIMMSDEGEVIGRIVDIGIGPRGLEAGISDLPAAEAVQAAIKLANRVEGGVVHVIDPEGLWDPSWGQLEKA